MSRIVLLFVIFVIILFGVGCKEDMPKGFENQEVYNNLVELLDNIDKRLDTRDFEGDVDVFHNYIFLNYNYEMNAIENDVNEIAGQLAIVFQTYAEIEYENFTDYKEKINPESSLRFEIVNLSNDLIEILELNPNKYDINEDFKD